MVCPICLKRQRQLSFCSANACFVWAREKVDSVSPMATHLLLASMCETRLVSNPNITRYLKKFVFPPPMCYDIPIPPKGERDYEQ